MGGGVEWGRVKWEYCTWNLDPGWHGRATPLIIKLINYPSN